MSQLRTAPDQRPGETGSAPARPPSSVLPVNFDLLGIDSIKKELQKLSATNQELLKAFNTAQTPLAAKPKEFGSSGNIILGPEAETLAKLQQENRELKTRVEELEEALRAATPDGWADQQQAFEQLLEEKSDVIRTLNLRIQEMDETLRGGPEGPGREELQALADDLERRSERLKQDEASLQTQLREMEMSMAKERAELARQKAQLQRAHTDLQRELEAAGRDPALRDRLVKLQTMATEGRPKTMMPNAEPRDPSKTPAPVRRPTTMAAIDLDADEEGRQSSSKGIFRRLFGG